MFCKQEGESGAEGRGGDRGGEGEGDHHPHHARSAPAAATAYSAQRISAEAARERLRNALRGSVGLSGLPDHWILWVDDS